MNSTPSAGFAPVANSEAEWRKEMQRLAQSRVPSFFHLRARLPKQGRTNQVLGASSCMNVVLKTYASGGENELHAHANEDHLFVIMQGRAVFYGPRDETREVARNDCVLIPAGAFYWFHASGDEPLVLLRVGATLDAAKDVMARVDAHGRPFDGYSEKNKELPLVLDERRVFE
ncbi:MULTISPECIES: cupin domain-containing protein [unclassified Variovorax]|uniref:cupin domain-containing protein n=1 Tax=unclassified Variovorax TaxID=663243 RepID=UPI00257922FA|nr:MULTISPECIES: cupin domain-containing protein [unclassified Variovorax]MDM0066961.1 cupin domain-containing protein [Variovorax sp. J31P207]MDM0084658.1 cupin domain-containing protein [Variovorax sp. J31P179]